MKKIVLAALVVLCSVSFGFGSDEGSGKCLVECSKKYKDPQKYEQCLDECVKGQ